MFHLARVLCLSVFCGLVLNAAPTVHGKKYVNCGGVYTESKGTFQFPDGPCLHHHHTCYCVYVISVPPGRKISLQFPAFYAQRSRSRSCSTWLEIYDGDDLTYGRICESNRNIDDLFKSETSQMIVVFKTERYSRRKSTATYYTYECGVPAIPGWRRRRSAGNKIVGGDYTYPGSYPWQASLRSARYANYHYCGGVLLNELWVVTAAHCCPKNPSHILVVLGNIWSDQHLEEEVFEVRHIFEHSKYAYDYYTHDNDIALLKLKHPVPFNDYVIPICLPDATFAVEDGAMLTVTGWGYTSEGGWSSSILREADVPVYNDADCEKAYGGGVNPSTMICAGYDEGGVDWCSGDNGGPLMYSPPDGGPAVLVGIASWGWGCARPGLPGVYTRVTTYVDWIQETMDKNP